MIDFQIIFKLKVEKFLFFYTETEYISKRKKKKVFPRHMKEEYRSQRGRRRKG